MSCNIYAGVVQGLDIQNTKQQSPKRILSQKNPEGLSSAGDIAQQAVKTLSNSEDHTIDPIEHYSTSLAKPGEELQRMVRKESHCGLPFTRNVRDTLFLFQQTQLTDSNLIFAQ